MSLLVRDRRLPSLLAYYPRSETAIDQAEIRAELASYRLAKVAAMALVHEVEHKIVECFKAVPERKRKKEKNLDEEQFTSIDRFGDGRHGDFLALLYTEQTRTGVTDKNFDLSCFKQAQLLRNAFSHNEYPKAEAFASIVEMMRLERIPENPAKHREVARRLGDEMKNLYEPWLTFLNSIQRKH